jgi:hypothetical protein
MTPPEDIKERLEFLEMLHQLTTLELDLLQHTDRIEAAQKDLEKLAAEVRACEVKRGERLSDTDQIERLDRLRAAVARKAELQPVVSDLITKSPAMLEQLIALLIKVLNHGCIGAFLPRCVEIANAWKPAIRPEHWSRLVANCPHAHLN